MFQVFGATYDNDRLANSIFDAASTANSGRAADRVEMHVR